MVNCGRLTLEHVLSNKVIETLVFCTSIKAYIQQFLNKKGSKFDKRVSPITMVHDFALIQSRCQGSELK